MRTHTAQLKKIVILAVLMWEILRACYLNKVQPLFNKTAYKLPWIYLNLFPEHVFLRTVSRGQWKEIYLMKTTLLWRIRKATARAEPRSGLNLVKITGPSFLN